MASEVEAESLRLSELLAPDASAHGLYLEKVELKVAGSHRTIHVVVDLPEAETGSVSLDQVSAVSRTFSDTLDADPYTDHRPYNLEVSSPGVNRPLTEPRHWRRALGRMVRVKAIHAEDVTGRLLEVTDDGITLRPELPVKKGMKAKQGEPVQLGFANIRRGTIEIEFAHFDEVVTDDDGTEGDEAENTAAEEA